jgi:CDP-diglyceride synthetase
MKANPGTPAWGLVSGAAVGTVFGIVFGAPLAGPVLGVLVGSRLLYPQDGRSAARMGSLTGALIGALLAVYSLIDSRSAFQPVVWTNMILASILFYALLSAAGGLLASWLLRLVEGGKYFL